MKILCVIDSLGSGGAQRQLVELAKGFKEKGHKVSFLTYHNINFFRPELVKHNIPVKTIIEPNYVKRLFKIRKAIRKHKPDSVLSFLEAANFMTTLAGIPLRKWKLVVGERSANPALLSSLKLRIMRIPLLFSDCIVANSYSNVGLFRKAVPIVPKRKFRVIYNALDMDLWSPSDQPIGIGEKVSILVAASHQYLKNAKGLLKALKELDENERKRIRITWYGDESPDNSFNEAYAYMQEHGLKNNIEFRQAIPDIRDRMLKSNVIGLFSFHEGFPNVICEGMSLGKPVISSSVSDLPKILGKDSSFLFNPRDIDSIKRTLKYILGLNPQELKKAGMRNRNIAVRNFERRRVIQEYLILMKQ